MSNGKQTEMKILFNFIFILFTSIALLSCDSNEPQSASTLNLSVEDVSCTEAWLQLKTANLNLPNRITLFVNDLKYREYLINQSDTLLYVDSLLPYQNYKFKVELNTRYNTSPTSNEILVQTIDTTSNNFIFQSWEFGNIYMSHINDVTIIDENDIWAVGEIYVEASVGSGSTLYNAVHWNGQQWELKKIETLFYGNWVITPLEGIFAFSSTDIWLGGSLPIHGDGTNWTIYDIRATVDPNLSVSRVWGSDPNNIYFVGRGGSIVHYNGSSFSKIESGTTIPFQDIFGSQNPKTGNYEVMTICFRNYPLEKAIYRIEGNTASQISTDPIEWELFSCWFVSNRHYYVVGSGMYEKSSLSENQWRNDPLDFTTHSIYKICGTGLNDIFCVGTFGEILHFNGHRWKSFIPELGTIDGDYYATDYKNDVVVAAGYEGTKAKIMVGIRN